MARTRPAFVPLGTLRSGPPSSRAALAGIRRIYFGTTPESIERDLLHAIELLTSIPTEDDRDKARVYMDGLAEMRREWAPRKRRPRQGGPKAKSRTR